MTTPNIYDITDDHFFHVDLGVITRQYQRWVKNLPNITPYYACKCNPDPNIIRTLNELGCHFDVASKAEIQLGLNCGVAPEKMIFANPCKSPDHIIYARDNSVPLMVADSEEEIAKIAQYYPEAEVLLRIKVDDSHSLCKFNDKYGLELAEITGVLEVAVAHGVRICGVSFHVGSSCKNKCVFQTAIHNAKYVVDIGRLYGFPMDIVDIGGGFPGEIDDGNFEEFADIISRSIRLYFGKSNIYENIRFIAEPGRYFVTASHTLVSSVIAKKTKIHSVTGAKTQIGYVMDGIYGAFSGIMFDYAKVKIEVWGAGAGVEAMGEGGEVSGEPELFNTTLFGPTCDSLDFICKNTPLPRLEVGDKIMVKNMGAYSVASATEFNGFPIPERRYVGITV